MQKLSVTIPSHLLVSFEHSVGMTCDAVGWMDWWLASVVSFEDYIPEDKRSFFRRVVRSGGLSLNFVARQCLGTYTNLLLLRRDRLIKEFSPQVPAEEVSALRHAELPDTAFVFPPDLATTATDKKRAAFRMLLSCRL